MSKCHAEFNQLRFSASGNHAAAFVGTLAASFGAALAVFVLMLAALFGAGIADSGANFGQLNAVLRSAGHQGAGKAADVGAVTVDPDAGGHHRYVFFA
jgi:hypothetical protein